MIDIGFYMRVFQLKKELMAGKVMDKEHLSAKLQEFISREPVIYNIETTNACNMRCQMCPRTTMMTRPVVNMDMELFKKLVAQISPFSDKEWREWELFVKEKYGIEPHVPSENHFFLYVIPKVIVLHGYGDPLLDKDMPARVRLLTERGIPSYFSCNPANINIDRTIEIFKNGLEYIKFSVECTDDALHKQVRGEASDFSKSYQNILRLIELKEKLRLKTVIVITMLDLNKAWQEEELSKLKSAFQGKDTYFYLKSQDQMWYQKNYYQTRSIHWTEFCQFPWSSMTVKSNGEAVSCVEDFNNEIILGDARKESLLDIWNGEKYRKFRQDHFDLTPGIKCTEQCDMKLIGSFTKRAKKAVS